MFEQRTLLNYDIPQGIICRSEKCPLCGQFPPYHSWNCGMNQKEKEDYLELIRLTGPCGQMECGKIITETCRNCDRIRLKGEKV